MAVYLGIDPGVRTVGIGIVSGDKKEQKAIDWLTITTPAKLPLPESIEEICADLEKIIREHKPTVAVIEKVYFSTNRTSAFDVAQARGAILLSLAQHGIEVLEVAPLELKMAICGDGKADKQQVQVMVQRILKLTEKPEPADAADALGMAVFGALTAQ